MKRIRPEHLVIVGLKDKARQAILRRQPKTRLELLAIPFVGRKTVLALVSAGLVIDEREPPAPPPESE